MNLMMLLEMAAGGFGDRTALGSRDGSGLTYQQLFDRAGVAAKSFRDAGVDRVALNYRLTSEELRSLAGQITPALAVVNSDTSEVVGDVDNFEKRLRDDFLADVGNGEAPAPDWDMDPEEIAILLYTSGTTGAPKAAVLRHKHLVSYILGSVEFMGAGEDEATLVSVPPYHVAGMAAICSSIYSGRRIVQLPNFKADEWVDLARREGVTHAMVVPTMLARIVEILEADGGGLPAMRAMSYGGGKMPRPVIEKALELLPETAFVNAYGLTETSSTIAVLGPDDHRDAIASDDPAVRRRLSSVGQPLPTLEVSIRDEDGEPVGADVSGEIWVRGEQVSGEYLGRDSRVTADGWFPTNDGGSIDEHGYLYVEGRIDDIIIRGGENISPGEIEDVLLTHEAIRDAAAIGIPDTQWGEIIAAVLVPTEGHEVSVADIQTFVKDRMRSSRTPDHIVVIDELPYNETGKLLRRVLREQFAHLGSTED
jgi:acyl-CoA synthetase (AMP-forming)/AMP-acid ligase II